MVGPPRVFREVHFRCSRTGTWRVPPGAGWLVVYISRILWPCYHSGPFGADLPLGDEPYLFVETIR